MSKNDFLKMLAKKLSHLSKEERDERINFYSEMIDDRIESGLSEKEAVEAIGSADKIAHQVAEELKSAEEYSENNEKIAKNKEKKGIPTWAIVLLIVGSPIWFSLIISAVAVVISIFVTVWSVIISLWAVFGALLGSGVGILIGGIYALIGVNALTGAALICGGLVCLGLSILFFFLCKAITKGTVILTKNIFTSIFTKKEEK